MVKRKVEGGGLVSALPAPGSSTLGGNKGVSHSSVGSRLCCCTKGSTSANRVSEGTVYFPVFYQMILFHEIRTYRVSW